MTNHFLFRTCIGSLLLLTTMLTAGQAEAQEDHNKNLTAESAISGTVRWSDGNAVNETVAHLHRWDADRQRWSTSEQSVSVGVDGSFRFEHLAADEYWCVAVQAPDAGTVFRQLVVDARQTKTVNVTLRPAAASHITVRDDAGQPLAGAKIRTLEIADRTEGSISIGRGSEDGLGIPIAISDTEGRLPLGKFSEGATLKSVWIDHPEFAAVRLLPDVELKSGEIATVQLKRGFPLHFDIRAPMHSEAPLALMETTVHLRHNRIENAASVLNVPYPLSNGGLDIQLEPGTFSLLRVLSESHVVLPTVSLDTNSRMRIAPGENDYWVFRAFPKVLVRGRVVTVDGKPVPKVYLTGDVRNLLEDGTPAPAEWGVWAHTGRGQTNSNGEYHVHLAPGSGRISYQGSGIPSTDHLLVTIDGLAEQRVPDIVVRDMPVIRGTVLGVDGSPARNAIVRVHSNSSVRYAAQPVVTGDDGRFEIRLDHLPSNPVTEEREYVHSVFAFLPDESVGGVTTVDLRNAETAANLTIKMVPQPVDWPLSAMSEGFTPWEQGDAASRPDKQVQMTAENIAGVSVPELDGSLWLNTDKSSLKEFRGQFVLLDFYTTWCGPCTRDFPTVKLVHDALGSNGVTVIAVHDNSSPHDLIREHAVEKGMEMPIVVDHTDGRLLKSWESLGLVHGYPSYVLIDPDGRLLAADRTIPAPLLRVYKVEIVRQYLLQAQLVRSPEGNSTLHK
ncbi:MAG: redoxin family protein [Planctomycetaceae bacterium]